MRFVIADRVGPEEASSAQPFRGSLDMVHEETGVSDHRGSTLIAINAGLMKPRKGFTPAMGNKKKGWARNWQVWNFWKIERVIRRTKNT